MQDKNIQKLKWILEGIDRTIFLIYKNHLPA
jgi:hypothetical protein